MTRVRNGGEAVILLWCFSLHFIRNFNVDKLLYYLLSNEDWIKMLLYVILLFKMQEKLISKCVLYYYKFPNMLDLGQLCHTKSENIKSFITSVWMMQMTSYLDHKIIWIWETFCESLEKIRRNDVTLRDVTRHMTSRDVVASDFHQTLAKRFSHWYFVVFQIWSHLHHPNGSYE